MISCIIRCGDQPKTLIGLVPSGGDMVRVGDAWVTSVRAAGSVQITAVTSPNTTATWALIRWRNVISADGQTAVRERAPVGEVCVEASLDVTCSVKFQFVQLASLTSETGAADAERDTWKCWAAPGEYAEVCASVDPDGYRYRHALPWRWADTGAARGDNVSVPGSSVWQRRVPLDHGGDRISITVRLFDERKTITVRVCQAPALQLDQLEFNGHEVACDERGTFDRLWERGRKEADPPHFRPGRPRRMTRYAAIAFPAGAINSVLCFTRNTPVVITARLTVTTPPTEDEVVTIRGRARIGDKDLMWQHVDLRVRSTDTVVKTTAMRSGDLPNHVARYDQVEIAWEMVGPDDRVTSLGTTTHLIYVLLADPCRPQPGANGAPPIPPVYWTLLELSCGPAHGAHTQAELASLSYAPLKKTTGDALGPRRARDGRRLSYYLLGVHTVAGYTTAELLHAREGSARCAAWAQLLVDMFAIHGVAARQTRVTPRNEQHSMLVRECTFAGEGDVASAPWTHRGHTIAGDGRCSKAPGIPGQGMSNPCFWFADHALVEYDGKVYDPSYGLEPYPSIAAWERDSIAGLADVSLGGRVRTFDGTPLLFPNRCSVGFIEHIIAARETLADIAARYGTTASWLWNHACNRALRQRRRGGMRTLEAGDTVIVPRAGTTITLLKRS